LVPGGTTTVKTAGTRLLAIVISLTALIVAGLASSHLCHSRKSNVSFDGLLRQLIK
jgi:hypothetical protein